MTKWTDPTRTGIQTWERTAADGTTIHVTGKDPAGYTVHTMRDGTRRDVTRSPRSLTGARAIAFMIALAIDHNPNYETDRRTHLGDLHS